MGRPGFRLLLVTDRRRVDDPLAAVRRALAPAPPGSVALMVREKDLSARELLALCRALREVTRDAGAPLLVNDRVDVALAAGADGVHLPVAGLFVDEARALLGPAALIGDSTHDREELARARDADYVSFGPVWDTPSKRGLLPATGPSALGSLGAAPPVFVLGGIDALTAPDALSAGVWGLACIRAVWDAPDPGDAVARFLSLLET